MTRCPDCRRRTIEMPLHDCASTECMWRVCPCGVVVDVRNGRAERREWLHRLFDVLITAGAA